MKILTENGPYDIDIPLNARGGGDGEYYMICPICNSTRKPEHQNEKKLAVNLSTKPYKWRCNHCGRGGHVKDENDFKPESLSVKPLGKYLPSNPVGEKMLQWFKESRGISKETLDILKISMSQENIRQQKHPDPTKKNSMMYCWAINFKYFYNDELINIKYRDKRKNFKLIKDASKIFYNIDSIKQSTYAVIVEGELDVAAYIEAGVFPVVSVPNGVTITKTEKEAFEQTGNTSVFGNLNLEYLDACIDDFSHLEKIIIATDDDPAGIKLREEIGRRLGKDKCRYVKFGEYLNKDNKPINDANELLLCHGKEKLRETINNTHEFPIQGVTYAIDYWDIISNSYDHGKEKGITTGYQSLDPHFNWMRSWTVALNGYPAEGKTSVALNLIAISTIIHKFKWGIYSPENYPVENIIDTLAEIFLNNTTNPDFGGKRISKGELREVIYNHIYKHFFFVDNEDGYSPKELREVKRELVMKKGINAFFTDPWSALEHKEFQGNREDVYLRNQLNAETRFSNRYKIINLISHHPPTPKDRSKVQEAPGAFSMIGGQIWFNKVFAILCVHRINREDPSDTRVGIHVQKIKEHKLAGIPTGQNEPVILSYKRRSGRFYEKGNLLDKNGDFNRYPFKTWESEQNLLFDNI